MSDGPTWRGAQLFEGPLWGSTLPGEIDPHLVRAAAEELERGHGALLLRGAVDEAELRARFGALVAALGTPVSQNAAGDTLLDVTDHGFAPGDPRFRGPHSNRRLSFHTDRCDVIAFACVRPARAGGENHVVSSRVLRDELRARHPEHAAVLERDALPYLRHTVDPANERPYTLVPVFTEHEGRFAASLLRVLVDRADAAPDAPDLTAEQRAALDALEEVAEDPDLYASFRLEAGDVLLLNNWTTFHRRTAFVDDAAAPRHLLRAWLSMPSSRALDPRYRDHFGATEAGALRGGIRAR